MKKADNDYPKRLCETVGLKIIGEYITSNHKHCLECQLCFKRFNATPKSKIANYNKSGLKGCPDCTRGARYKEVDNKNKARLIDMGYKLLEDYNGLKVKILLTNTECSCGRSWRTTPERIFSGRSFCKPCNDERKADKFRQYNEEKYQESLLKKSGFEKYQKEVRVLTERTYKKNVETINPEGLIRGPSGIEGSNQLDHIMSLKYCFTHDIPADVCSHQDNLRVIPWMANAVKWKRPSLEIPEIMWEYVDSYEEKLKFLAVLKKEIKNIKKYKKPKDENYTLDLIHGNIGILCHRYDDVIEQTTGSRSRLKQITQYFSDKGIRVIHIFEDEWLHNRKMIISKLKHILGEGNMKNKVYARKCEIGLVPKKSKAAFLKCNHVQGNDSSVINLGAYYDGELVAVMTFCRPRVFMKERANTSNKWELSRFATEGKYVVVGIASKLLKHFMRNNEWDEIYSFADLRWSDSNNNVYLTLGFEASTESTLGYTYLIDGVRKHRWRYRKSEIRNKFPDKYDSNLTEYQNMLNLGYDRIWDCGVQKYSIINT